ncbi:MAG: hypothetical protein ACRDJ4_05430 [Actinomycetota bacterium]
MSRRIFDTRAAIRLEHEVGQIPGVAHAEVVQERPGHGMEMHVLTGGEASLPDVRRSIEEVLARNGLGDKKHVFVFSATEGRKPPIPADRAAAGQPKLIEELVEQRGTNEAAMVRLVLERLESRGTGRGPTSPHHIRVAAATTLEAAEALMGVDGAFVLQSTALVELFGLQVAAVLVRTGLTEPGVLLGTCIVGDRAPHEAAVRATLDAINRQFALRPPD